LALLFQCLRPLSTEGRRRLPESADVVIIGGGSLGKKNRKKHLVFAKQCALQAILINEIAEVYNTFLPAVSFSKASFLKEREFFLAQIKIFQVEFPTHFIAESQPYITNGDLPFKKRKQFDKNIFTSIH
jgi:hypothetical protein